MQDLNKEWELKLENFEPSFLAGCYFTNEAQCIGHFWNPRLPQKGSVLDLISKENSVLFLDKIYIQESCWNT